MRGIICEVSFGTLEKRSHMERFNHVMLIIKVNFDLSYDLIIESITGKCLLGSKILG
jgi:hypothetical protein